MRRNVFPALVLGLFFLVSPGAAATVTVTGKPLSLPKDHLQLVGRSLERHEAYSLDLAAVDRAVRATGGVRLALGSRVLDLSLTPIDVRAPGYRSVRSSGTAGGGGAVGTWRGKVAGDSNSEVRLVVLPDLLQGFVRTGATWLYIDPLRRFLSPATPSSGPPADRIVVYRDEEVREQAGVCGIERRGAGPLAAHRVDFEAYPMTKGFAASRTVTVATDADYQYYGIYGANTETHIQGVISQVSSIYESQVGMTLTVGFQHVFDTSTQPYSSTDSSVLLGQLTTEWNNNHKTVTRDFAHLFTGKDLDQNIIGIAFVGVVWAAPYSAYGLSQDYSAMVKLTAHEIGHNFNAEHVCNCGSCSTCAGSGPLMCSCVQGSGPQSFSEPSVCTINDFVTHHAP